MGIPSIIYSHLSIVDCNPIMIIWNSWRRSHHIELQITVLASIHLTNSLMHRQCVMAWNGWKSTTHYQDSRVLFSRHPRRQIVVTIKTSISNVFLFLTIPVDKLFLFNCLSFLMGLFLFYGESLGRLTLNWVNNKRRKQSPDLSF